MVVLHMKRSDLNQFLIQTTTAITIDDLTALLVNINNLRLKVDRAAVALEDLAAKGPLKSEGLRGLSEDTYDEYLKNEDITVRDGLKVMPPNVGERQVKDDTHYRTGWVIGEDLTQKMLDHAMEMKKIIHKSSVDAKRYLTPEMLTEQLDIVRGLMMMAYPGFHGLGEWEPIWLILENKEEMDEKMNLTEDLAVDNTILWIVNKEMQSGKTFSGYFGSNEKSKMVVKVTKRGGGAPQREPMIDEETHKRMLSFYHKKNEEHKKMEELDDGDQYLGSAWADSGMLKRQMQGTGDIRMKF